MKHDDDDVNNCSTRNTVMSAFIQPHYLGHRWSSCSAAIASNCSSKNCLFEKSRNKDVKAFYKYQGWYFTRQQQCEMFLRWLDSFLEIWSDSFFKYIVILVKGTCITMDNL